MGRNGPPPGNLGEPMVSPAPPKRFYGIAGPGTPIPYAACYVGEDGKIHPSCPVPVYVSGSFDPAALRGSLPTRAADRLPPGTTLGMGPDGKLRPNPDWTTGTSPRWTSGVDGAPLPRNNKLHPLEPPRVTTYTLQPRPDWLGRAFWAVAAVVAVVVTWVLVVQ